MIDQILNAREMRSFHVKKSLEKSPLVLLIKANIPGNNKNIWIAKYLALLFKKLLEHTCQTTDSYLYQSDDGPYVIINLPSDDIISIKHCLMHIEETHPLGRFIDLDLFDTPHRSISRSEIDAPLRTCMLCESPAIECMRNHNHHPYEIIQHIEKNVISYLQRDMKKQIDLAIISELELEDKFGLVTKSSSGSHFDMNYQLMIQAKDAILDDLVEVFTLGLNAENLEDLFPEAKAIGIKAEHHMLDVTKGINCYKGLITVLGFACLSSGYGLKNQSSFLNIFENIKILSKDLVSEINLQGQTFGIKAYQKYQFEGIRGELSRGLPTVKSILKSYESLSYEDPITLRKALKDIILLCEDTVFLKRSQSLDTYHNIKKELSTLDMDDSKTIKEFTEKMVSKNVSFGGSADLLITTIYLQNIRHLYT